jgi:hypothetical protein
MDSEYAGRESGLVLAAYVLIGIWQERNDCASSICSQCYAAWLQT